MSSGRVVNVLPSTVVRISTRGGVEGFGESCPLGRTVPARVRRGRAGRAARARAGAARRRRDEPRRGQRSDGCDSARPRVREERRWTSRAGTSSGEVAGLPVATLLGGVLQARAAALRRGPARSARRRWRPSSNASAPAGSTTSSSSSATRRRRDRDRVAAVHAVTDSEDAIIGDANGGWRRQDAIIAARLLERFDRLRLEQPCATPRGVLEPFAA